jgi:hypothetical protein
MTNADDSHTRHRCVDCGVLSPKTDTNYTLISARHGWRLIRRLNEAGANVLEWRCPGCWQKFRRPA